MDTYKNSVTLFLLTTFCYTVSAQPPSEKDTKYVISGTGVFGGYGLFTLASADVLPKGRFAGGTTYETRTADIPASIKYSLGFGLASRAETFVVFSNALGSRKNDLSQVGLKVNVIRGDVWDDFLGSIEVGYMQADKEINGSLLSYETLLGRLQAGVLIGNVEVIGSLGYAVQLGESAHADRFLIGGAAFVPVLRNITIGAEISSDHSATVANGLGFGAGVKVGLFDHFQVMIIGRSMLNSSRLTPSLSFGLSFSSAFYHIATDRKRSLSRVPPLPTLDELEKRSK